MDTTPSDFAAGAGDFGTRASQPHMGARWFWAPLAIGTALTIITSAIQQLKYMFLIAMIGVPLLYTHQAALTAISLLVVPVVVALSAMAFALRAPGIANRRAPVVWLLCALAVEIGVVVFVSVAGNALLAAFNPTQGAANVQPPGATVLGTALAATNWFPLGVSLAVAMGVLTPRVAPRAWLGRLGYWLLAGALAGLSAAFFTLLTPVLLDTLSAARLQAVGVINCQAGSGSSCLPGQLLFLMQNLGLSPLVGMAFGAAIGGFLAPERARPFAATSIEPAESGERRSWLARVGRSLATVALGAVYAGLVVGLISALSIGRNFNLPTQAAGWYYALEILAVLSPAGWLALVLARRRLAATLDDIRKRALRWALLVFAALIAIIVPVVIGATTGPFFAGDSTMVSLIAFSFGAAFGLTQPVSTGAQRGGADWWAGAEAAFTGWLGVAIPAAVLAGVSVYSFITYNSANSGCHGLGCGGLLMAGYSGLVSGFVYLIVYGLLAAAAGGAVGGMLRATLRPV